ncbi:hypothetical protein JOB18_005864 [Solea senegalensis]|uniref:Uncharacterized protein n=1 Tax=Solea senegalensis TaxID=28829 RepID=A0AAV6RLY4_SOLSE|nr:hypothetical protein JOB18_005864 [Solea senegalensis]
MTSIKFAREKNEFANVFNKQFVLKTQQNKNMFKVQCVTARLCTTSTDNNMQIKINERKRELGSVQHTKSGLLRVDDSGPSAPLFRHTALTQKRLRLQSNRLRLLLDAGSRSSSPNVFDTLVMIRDGTTRASVKYRADC